MASSGTERGGPGEALRVLLDAAGPPLSVAGNTPFLLDDRGRAWWLQAGRIELFVVGLVDGEPQGARSHFASLGPGALLFGTGPARGAPAQWALLAVPHVDTRVIALDRAALEALDADAVPDLARAADQWLLALSQGLAGWVSPTPVFHHAVSPGATFSAGSHERVSGGPGIGWFILPADSALFLDTQELPADSAGMCLLPLSALSWIRLGRPLASHSRSTADVLRAGGFWRGLDTLHGLLLPTAGLNQMLRSVDEHNRLRRRAESADRDWRRGMASLQGVLEPPAAAPHADAQPQPLVQALQAIARHEGFSLRLPASDGPDGEPAAHDLQAVLRASGWRSREVVLDAGWQACDTSAMLAFAQADGRPIVILPRSGRVARLYDPVRGVVLRADAPEPALAPGALVFTVPLPAEAQGLRVLGRFALRRGRRDLLALLCTSLGAGALAMAVPIALAWLIDVVVPAHDGGLLLQLGLILGIVAFTGFALDYAGGIAATRAQARIGPALQAALVDRLLRLPAAFFRHHAAGDLAMRASAVTRVGQAVSGSASHALAGGIMALFSLGLLFYYDARLAGWAALASGVYAGVTLWLAVRQSGHEASLARQEGALQGLVLQWLGGIAKLRQAASEDRVFARWARLFSGVQDARRRAALHADLQALLDGLFGLACLLAFFLLIAGQPLPDDRSPVIGIGALAAFLAGFSRLGAGLAQLGDAAASLVAMRPLLKRALPILQARPESSQPGEAPGVLAGAIELSDVCFRYAVGAPRVLDRISLRARPGEFIAIVGPSGCGKSTLLRLLLGFEQAESGSLRFDGRELRELDVLAVRRQMGVVLQHSQAMPGTLYENIAGAAHAGLEEAWTAAREAGLADDIAAMPMGMHTVITEGGGSLSAGQLQRLMIARAIVSRPRILLLDEATSALDNRVQALISDNLDRLSMTRIVVAHRLSTVARAHRIHVLEGGRIVESGSYAELMALEGAFARLAAAQLV